jgi:23S rRNA (cytosine1962-C5)-methyltransferase
MMLDQLPQASDKRIAVHVHSAAERNLKQGHPWLFESGISTQSHEGQAGDLAVIFDRKRRFLAIGLYDPRSPIRVRVLHQGKPAIVNEQFFCDKLTVAATLRKPLLDSGTNGYRLVHGENDGLPGLVIDRYAQTCAIKIYSAAWIPHLNAVLSGIQGEIHPERVVLRLSRNTEAALEPAWNLSDGLVLVGAPISGPIRFSENGLIFEADVLHGQKTGFFLDQRENRSRVEERSAEKSVLNVFAYSGGFSLYAARGGAHTVVSLDSSGPALQAAQEIFALNQGVPEVAAAKHETVVADAFAAMKEMRKKRRQFDMVIIDPPSFAKQASEIDGAMRAYARLVQLGLALVRPHGTLVMASCSSRIQADQFYELIHETARSSHKVLRDIEVFDHAIDHPIGFREGAYLKCMFARVEPISSRS